MSVAKIAITMEASLVEQVDRLVREHVYPNRSRTILEAAVAEKREAVGRGGRLFAEANFRAGPVCENLLAHFQKNLKSK